MEPSLLRYPQPKRGESSGRADSIGVKDGGGRNVDHPVQRRYSRSRRPRLYSGEGWLCLFGVIAGVIQRVSNNKIRNRNSHKKRVGRGHVKRDGPSTPHTWLLTWQFSGQCQLDIELLLHGRVSIQLFAVWHVWHCLQFHGMFRMER